MRLVLRTFSSISLRWEVLVKCEKFTSVVCVAVQNKPKIRMNNWDSKFFFCFHQARKSKQSGKNCGHTHSTGWRSAARYFEDLFPSRRSLSFYRQPHESILKYVYDKPFLGIQSISNVGWQTYGKTKTNTNTKRKKPQCSLKMSGSVFV